MLWGEEPKAEGKKKSLRLFNTLSRGGGIIQTDRDNSMGVWGGSKGAGDD